MKNLLEYIIIHLVQHPEDVTIEERAEEDGSVEFLVTVNAEDRGRVIGRHGNVIQAIRSIAKVRAVKEQIRVRITLVE